MASVSGTAAKVSIPTQVFCITVSGLANGSNTITTGYPDPNTSGQTIQGLIAIATDTSNYAGGYSYDAASTLATITFYVGAGGATGAASWVIFFW